jgi:DNA-binding CsgD family transcriptional regulator/tetratricopeptide (TPR) repeat protein
VEIMPPDLPGHTPPAAIVSPVFVGRTAELTAARGLIERAENGESGVMLVCGEAGVGKTRLVDEAVRHARGRQLQVLSGHCVQLGIEGLPFAPVVEALRELVRTTGRERLEEILGPARDLVARLLPVAAASETETAPPATAQLLELVLGLLERLSESAPVLVVIEDLHWADRSTLELAAFLARNLRGVPVAILITYRSDEVDRRHPLRVLLATWERTRSISRLELGRLDRDEVRAQLSAILGAVPDPKLLDLVYERSEGNAFLVEEMLSAVRAGDPRGLPPSLKDVLLARVDRLGEPAVQLLRLAAVAGRSVPERLLVAVCEVDELSALAAIREAVDAHLLVVDSAGHGYTFRHALARDAVYDDLLPGERVRLHAAYAEALTRDPGLLDETNVSVAASLAHHAYAALDLPRALEASIAAGRESFSAMASREALAQYERALLIWDRVPAELRPPEVDQAEVLWLAGEAAYHGGNVDRALALLTESAAVLPADATPERRARVLHRCARAHRDLGHLGTAIELLESALAPLPDEPVTWMRATVLAALSVAHLRELHPRRAARYAELAVAAARSVDAAQVEAEAQISLGSCRMLLGPGADGLAAMRAGLELALASGDAHTTARGYINLSDACETLGRSTEAAEVAEAGIAFAQRSGLLRSVGAYLVGNLAESLVHLGDWARARMLIDDALADGPEGVFELTLQLIGAELAALAGDLERSRTMLERAQVLTIGPDDDQFALPLVTLEAELARAGRDHARAVRIVLDNLNRDDRSPRYAWPLLWVGVRVEVERALADPAGTIAERLGSLVATMPATDAPTQGYRALCEAELGRLGGTADWDDACAAWRKLGWAWPLGYSLLRQAEAQAERREPARESAVEAWTIAARLGAGPLLSEVQALARRAGIDLDEQSRPADPLAALGLTAREQEVLKLVATGRSNPQIARELFISPKTASVHVSNILGKLGLTSRVQAAALLHRLGC